MRRDVLWPVCVCLAIGPVSAQDSPAPPDCCTVPNLRALAILQADPASTVAAEAATPDAAVIDAPDGMVAIPGGTFMMGTDDMDVRGVIVLPHEYPAHAVTVDPFWMDETEVTNAQFAAFVEATGYVTTAERVPTMEEIMAQLPPGTPEPSPDILVAGSLVFTMTPGPVALNNPAQWWRWTLGASWRHPQGPDSSIEGIEDHPVVHVSYDDALAYCAWAGRRLPTEAEWEFAARGGLDGTTYAWGNEPTHRDTPLANTWDGSFPYRNAETDGYVTTAPVRSFPPNGYGLYDTAGNAWEWCSDWLDAAYYRKLVRENGGDATVPTVNPQGPDRGYDPNQPYAQQRVVRGGSFLCSDAYCSSYRPSARMGSTPDTGLSHTGFRTVWQPGMTPANAPATD